MPPAFRYSRRHSFPTRTITLVVPFAAGGPSDAIARLLAQSMARTLRQQVVIENVAGAGGTTGAARVAKAEADGQTLLIHHIASPAGASLYRTLTYDTLGDFETLGLVNFGPMVLASKKDFAARDAKELFAKLKADGAKITLAHAGIGIELASLRAHHAAGTGREGHRGRLSRHGTGHERSRRRPGRHPVRPVDHGRSPIQGNTIKAFAVTSSGRLDTLATVPTMKEAGLSDFEFVIWHGLYAPKGTPKEAVARSTKRCGALSPTLRSGAASPMSARRSFRRPN